MKAFVDTSAFLALLDADDRDHERVRAALDDLTGARARLVTSSYVVVETTALLQRRIGLAPVRAFHERLLPICQVVWVDQRLHDLAYRALTVADRRHVSLVDWTSFEVMRHHAIPQALTLDEDFTTQGYATLP